MYVRNVGICSYSYSAKTLKAVFSLAKEVKAMKLASDGNLWLGTDEGLFLFNTKTGIISANYFSNKCSVTDLLVDKKKNSGSRLMAVAFTKSSEQIKKPFRSIA
ncbi:hypothetical protein ACQ9BO_18900 [Flavobacterium sp. P21]|uniref:hypothetical protein n=1 Tax=Flavobacterium sp. P21 TaxID=3423948 RepID=UPI003D663BDD